MDRSWYGMLFEYCGGGDTVGHAYNCGLIEVVRIFVEL